MSLGVTRRARRTVVAAIALLLLSALAAASVEARPAGAFTKTGTVTRVVDGDTVDVVLRGGARERVRLIGIDTPERGSCFASSAAAEARRLALGKQVVLKGDATQDTRDRYGRLLAYVWMAGGKDLGYQLIGGGFGKVYVYRDAFQRLGAYRRAEQAAKGSTRGQGTHARRPAAAEPRALPAATRATRRAFRSPATSTAPTSARWGRRPCVSSARIRTGSTATTTALAASSSQPGRTRARRPSTASSASSGTSART
jgi:endonuclease YncB( thermonuclease family)